MRALENRFLDLNQVAFWDGQEAENEFKLPCEPLKHRIFGWSGGIKCVPSARRPLES